MFRFILCFGLLTSYAFAQQSTQAERIPVTAVAGAGAVGGGYFAVKKFTQAKETEKLNTLFLIKHQGVSQDITPKMIEEVTSSVRAKDKVVISYHLSEAENRKAWVKNFESKASRANSQAAYYKGQATQALIPRKLADGKYSMPDLYQASYYNNLAKEELDKAMKFMKKSVAIQNGEKVDWFKFSKTVEGLDAPENFSKQLHKLMSGGGKVYSIKYTPSEVLSQASKSRMLGSLGIITSVVGTGAAIYNQLSGAITDFFSGSDDSRSISNLDRSSGTKDSSRPSDENRQLSSVRLR